MQKYSIDNKRYFFQSINPAIWDPREDEIGNTVTFYSTKAMQVEDYILLYIGKKYIKRCGIYAIAQIIPGEKPDENGRKVVNTIITDRNRDTPMIPEEECETFIRTYRSVHRISNTKALNKALKNIYVDDEYGVNSSNAINTDDVGENDVPEPKQQPMKMRNGVERYERNHKKSSKALELAHYQCECDSKHETFHIENGHMYVEAHHLIPWNKYSKFDVSIDVISNIVSLCSVCHDCIHHGTKKDQCEMIKILYKKRRKRLKKAGLDVSLDQLLKYYGIDDSTKDKM